jgi:hypothetical protein
MAVSAMIQKLVTNNVDTIIGNMVMQWSGFRGTDVPAEEQPKRFIDIIWPIMCLSTAFDETVAVVLRWLWKEPGNREQVEAELVERRAVAKKLKEEALLGEQASETVDV